MIISFIFFVLLTLTSFGIYKCCTEDFSDVGSTLVVICSILLACMIFVTFGTHFGNSQWIEGYKQTKDTIANQRAQVYILSVTSRDSNVQFKQMIENAAMSRDIIKLNSELAKKKHLNRWCDLLVSDEIDKLEPLK